MNQDDLIWEIINHQFCSFKAILSHRSQKVANSGKEYAFCRNTENVTGLCSRQSCPLANSKYATLQEDLGNIYLWIKTVERAHTPNKLYEKILLPKNYTEALKVIDQHLEFFPKFLLHKNKQRLTKMHQMLQRMRNIKKAAQGVEGEMKLVPIFQKVERIERSREERALNAAMLEQKIQKELIERLKSGTYGDIYNYPSKEFDKALDEIGEDEQDQNSELEEFEDGEEVEGEFVEADEDEEMEDEYEYEMDGLNNLESSEKGSAMDMEDMMLGQSRSKKKRRGSIGSAVSEGSGVSGMSGLSEKILQGLGIGQRPKPTVEVEYEYEEENLESNPKATVDS